MLKLQVDARCIGLGHLQRERESVERTFSSRTLLCFEMPSCGLTIRLYRWTTSMRFRRTARNAACTHRFVAQTKGELINCWRVLAAARGKPALRFDEHRWRLMVLLRLPTFTQPSVSYAPQLTEQPLGVYIDRGTGDSLKSSQIAGTAIRNLSLEDESIESF